MSVNPLVYWNLIDESKCGYTKTYEHEMPHGTLIRVSTTRSGGCAESVVFVPTPPTTEPYR